MDTVETESVFSLPMPPVLSDYPVHLSSSTATTTNLGNTGAVTAEPEKYFGDSPGTCGAASGFRNQSPTACRFHEVTIGTALPETSEVNTMIDEFRVTSADADKVPTNIDAIEKTLSNVLVADRFTLPNAIIDLTGVDLTNSSSSPADHCDIVSLPVLGNAVESSAVVDRVTTNTCAIQINSPCVNVADPVILPNSITLTTDNNLTNYSSPQAEHGHKASLPVKKAIQGSAVTEVTNDHSVPDSKITDASSCTDNFMESESSSEDLSASNDSFSCAADRSPAHSHAVTSVSEGSHEGDSMVIVTSASDVGGGETFQFSSLKCDITQTSQDIKNITEKSNAHSIESANKSEVEKSTSNDIHSNEHATNTIVSSDTLFIGACGHENLQPSVAKATDSFMETCSDTFEPLSSKREVVDDISEIQKIVTSASQIRNGSSGSSLVPSSICQNLPIVVESSAVTSVSRSYVNAAEMNGQFVACTVNASVTPVSYPIEPTKRLQSEESFVQSMQENEVRTITAGTKTKLRPIFGLDSVAKMAMLKGSFPVIYIGSAIITDMQAYRKMHSQKASSKEVSDDMMKPNQADLDCTSISDSGTTVHSTTGVVSAKESVCSNIWGNGSGLLNTNISATEPLTIGMAPSTAVSNHEACQFGANVKEYSIKETMESFLKDSKNLSHHNAINKKFVGAACLQSNLADYFPSMVVKSKNVFSQPHNPFATESFGPFSSPPSFHLNHLKYNSNFNRFSFPVQVPKPRHTWSNNQSLQQPIGVLPSPSNIYRHVRPCNVVPIQHAQLKDLEISKPILLSRAVVSSAGNVQSLKANKTLFPLQTVVTTSTKVMSTAISSSHSSATSFSLGGKIVVIPQSKIRKTTMNASAGSINNHTLKLAKMKSNFSSEDVRKSVGTLDETNPQNFAPSYGNGVLIKFEDGFEHKINNLKDVKFCNGLPVKSWDSLPIKHKIIAKHTNGKFCIAVVKKILNANSQGSQGTTATLSSSKVIKTVNVKQPAQPGNKTKTNSTAKIIGESLPCKVTSGTFVPSNQPMPNNLPISALNKKRKTDGNLKEIPAKKVKKNEPTTKSEEINNNTMSSKMSEVRVNLHKTAMPSSSPKRPGVLVRFEDNVELWIDRLRELMYLDDEPVKAWNLKRGTEVAAKYTDGLFYDAVVLYAFDGKSSAEAKDEVASSDRLQKTSTETNTIITPDKFPVTRPVGRPRKNLAVHLKSPSVKLANHKESNLNNDLPRVHIKKLQLGDGAKSWNAKIINPNSPSKRTRSSIDASSSKDETSLQLKCAECFLVFQTIFLFRKHQKTVCGSEGIAISGFKFGPDVAARVDEKGIPPLVSSYKHRYFDKNGRMKRIPCAVDGRRCFRRGTHILHRWQTEDGSKWYNGKILRQLGDEMGEKSEFEVRYMDDDQDGGPYVVNLYEDYPHDIRIVTR